MGKKSVFIDLLITNKYYLDKDKKIDITHEYFYLVFIILLVSFILVYILLISEF